MNARIPNHHAAHASSGRNLILWLLAAGCLLLVVLGLLRPRPNDNAAALQGPTPTARPAASENFSNVARDRLFARLPHRRSSFEPAPTPEQVVSNKVSQFAQSRRTIAEAMAKKFDLKLSADVERFFAAAEAGRWEELKTLFEDFKQRIHSDEPAEDLRKVWPAIFET